ncbi:hypothetical protein MD484_g6104, partial [Candolleomyces efflorescens]
MLYTSQDKPRQGPVSNGQRGILNQKGGNREGMDDGGRRKDTPEIEVPKSRSAIYGSRSPAGDASERPEHAITSLAPAPPPTYHSNDEDVLLQRLAEHRSRLKAQDAQIEKLRQAHDAVLSERDLARSDSSAVRSQLSNVTTMVADLRANNATAEQRCADACEKLADLQSTLASANTRIELLTSQSDDKEEENRRIRQESRQLAHQVQILRASMEEQHATFAALKSDHQSMTVEVRELRSNVSGLRSSTAEALEASVLAEYKLRIEELEAEKKVSFAKIHQDYEDLKTHYERSASLEKKVADLTEKLVAREVETFDYLATSVGLEERLEAGKSEIARLSSIISDQEVELTSLRKSKEEHLERLLAAQEVANAKDKELVTIRAELKNMVESKEELKALLSEAKITIAERDEELTRRRDPNPELEIRVRELSTQLERCHLDSGADKERLLESHLESGKLQATQAFLNEANQEKTRKEEQLNEARTELACLKLDQKRLQSLVDEVGEEKRKLEQNLERTRTELACLKQEELRLKSLVDEERQAHSRKINSDLISQKKLVEAQEMRAVSAENAFKLSHKELTAERLKIGELTTQISVLTSSLDQARALLAEQEETLARLQPTVNLTDLQAMIEKLTIERDELKEHADRILGRYHQGSLSNVEKDFVQHILHISESTHEQNLLEKDQEIRSRENALAGLQQRVKGLEKTLAKVLDDPSRSGDARPIVNLKTLMTSSPKEEAMFSKATGIHTIDGSGKSEAISLPTMPAESGTSFKQLAQMNSDSDDDIPLSELSSISSESGTNKKRVRLDSPPPPPAPPSAHSKRRGKTAANKRGRPGASSTTEKALHDTGSARGRQVKRK